VLVAGVWAVLTGCGPHDTATGPTSTASATALVATFPLATPTVLPQHLLWRRLIPLWHHTPWWCGVPVTPELYRFLGHVTDVTVAAFRVTYGGSMPQRPRAEPVSKCLSVSQRVLTPVERRAAGSPTLVDLLRVAG
jgi:hypothetical protein